MIKSRAYASEYAKKDKNNTKSSNQTSNEGVIGVWLSFPRLKISIYDEFKFIFLRTAALIYAHNNIEHYKQMIKLNVFFFLHTLDSYSTH